MDFIRHKVANADPDLVASYLCDILAKDSPVIALEKSLAITGAAQTLVYNAPSISDPNIGAQLALIGVEVAIQLNNLAIPNTDFKFQVQFLNAFGTIIGSMTQEVSGTASVIDGTTRQYMRFLAFQRFGSYTDGNPVQYQDGRSVSFPKFCAPDAVQLAALTAIVAAPILEGTMAELRYNVASVQLDIPAGSITAGVTLTITPIVSGRQDTIEGMISALDIAGAATNRPLAQNNTSTEMGE